MAGVPVVFRKSGEGVLANYDYIDVAEGTGIVKFYLALERSNSVTSGLLTREQVYSSGGSGDIVNQGLIYFDSIPFNMPKRVKGTAYVSIGIYEVAAGAYYLDCQIQKVSNGVVTNCSAVVSTGNVNGNGAHMMTFSKIPLTATNFKKGDILRLSIQPQGGGGGDESFGIDPMGRDGTYITSALTTPTMTTKSILYMSFDIDV